jgi:signal transduction histidine kinase
VLAVTPDATRLPPGGRAVPPIAVLVGWSFVGVGAYAWLRRPDNPTGALMAAFGIGAQVSVLSISDAALPYVLSAFSDPLSTAVFIHLLLAFPTGRLDSTAARVVVAAAYTNAIVTQTVALLLGDRPGDEDCGDCPDNLLRVADHQAIADVAGDVQRILGAATVVTALALVVRGWRRADAFHRRGFAPLATAGAGILALGLVSAVTQETGASEGVQKAAQLVFVASFVSLPAAFLVGLARTRFFRGAAVSDLIARLTAEGGAVEAVLADALGDPSLVVAYWLPERGRYTDRRGRPLMVPDDATEVVHHGRRVGALVHDAALRQDPQLLRAAAAAAALALENGRLEVELRARVEALRASRARIVEVGDEERRKLGRDLHDGAQQRLVTLLIELRMARDRWDDKPEMSRSMVDSALENAGAAVQELRDLAAGIHPAILSQRGLDAAVETLASRSTVPVETDLELDERPPSNIETAAYFVVAEALTNVAKYADATHARVVARRLGGSLVIEIRDDGKGGAEVGAGSGLRGLEDRVGAVDGTLEVESPPGRGTVVRARFPLAA